MIRSICFNPVIDKMYFVDDFSAGNKFREITPQICVGGKGVNIARVAAQLSEPCTLYAFIGGYGGQLIREEMEQLGVDFKYCSIESNTRTTINVIDRKNNRETEITEQGATVTPEQEACLLNMLRQDITRGDIVICSGIPMNGMTAGVYKTISGWCEEQGARCILDTNNRYMLESLPAKYAFMKPNLLEIQELHGVEHIQDNDHMLALARKTLEMGVENLMVSTGRTGGQFYSRGQAFQITVPDEPVVSTIGSGDATVAGFCIALKRGYGLEDCLKFAMACGVCNAMFAKVGYVEEALVSRLATKVIVKPMECKGA